MSQRRHFLLCCGGTGGHLSPGIAVAEALRARGHTCQLVVSRKEVDSRLLARYPQLPALRSPGVGLSRSPLGAVRFAWAQLGALVMALRLIHSHDTAAVIAFGGFLSAPWVVAARLLGRPVILHEANRVAGRAIRRLARWAQCVFLPPKVSWPGCPVERCRPLGFPVRAEMQPLQQRKARRKLALPTDGPLLVVLGGSQGARALNEWAHTAFPVLAEKGWHLLCITGMQQVSEVILREHGCEAHFRPFTTAMAEVLSGADLAVARAGAGTIAELRRFRLPAVLVPYPYAADAHQDANASWQASLGGAIVVPQSELNTLTATVCALAISPERREAMRAALSASDTRDTLGEFVATAEHLTNGQSLPSLTEPRVSIG